ncbi:MAG TPA: ABC transporter permease subunit [Candidatus Binatia bacterium]|nr:ABC transporter permease subunit [Candidatus Binatia bacterium]
MSGLRDIGPPLAVLGLAALLWHAAVVVFALPPYVLPPPAAVAAEAWRHAGELGAASALTGAAALAGLAASVVGGVLVAFVFAQSRLLARSLYPYAIFLQTVPIVAVAPLIILWFGTGFGSVVVVAFIVGVFPVIAGATAGFTSVERDLVDLFRVHGATRWQVFWKLRLPHAVPQLVTAAEVSGGLAVVGAIMGEVFAGYGAGARGLGYLVVVTAGQLKTAYLFAVVLAATGLGLVVFGALRLTGDAVCARWRDVA